MIAGCGYLGREVARLLRERGEAVTALTASEPSTEELRGLGLAASVCDISDPASVAALAAALPTVDAVIHCAASGKGGGVDKYEAVFKHGAQNLIRAFPCARLIFTSSSSVYPQIDGSWVAESTPADPPRPNGKILREAEDAVLRAGGTVLRLAGLYGPGRSVLLRQFLEGTSQIDVRTEPPASPDGRWINQIHRDDAARAILHVMDLEEKQARSQIYNVSDSRPLTQREVYTYLAARYTRPMPPEGPPDPNRKRGWSHKRVSNAKLRTTGWSPLYPSWFEAIENDSRIEGHSTQAGEDGKGLKPRRDSRCL